MSSRRGEARLYSGPKRPGPEPAAGGRLLRSANLTPPLSLADRKLRSQALGRDLPILRLLAALALAPTAIVPAWAQAAPNLCASPTLPSVDLPEHVLTEFRNELSSEFEEYFSSIGRYIACLDAERDRALAEARNASDAYASFLSTPDRHEEAQ